MSFDRNGCYDLSDGKIASVVTYLDMDQRPASHGLPARDDLQLRAVQQTDLAWYRGLFRAIGTDLLWFSRLQLGDAELEEILSDPAVELFALVHEGEDKGLLELDRRQAPDVELAFFGLTPDLIGAGAGRWLMAQAIERAFAQAPCRFWLHTCSMDHPEALNFYLRSGFRPYKRAIEIADDPRLTGILARGVASHIPLIE